MHNPDLILNSLACPRAGRRGISLLEVLISMFVLLIGLLGVAAMIPAGRFEILQGTKVDHASMIGRSAFRDLKVRGYLNPGYNNGATVTSNWYDPSATTAVWAGGAAVNPFISTIQQAPAASMYQLAVAIDPLGCFAPGSFGINFPYGIATSSSPGLMRITPTKNMTYPLADVAFRNADDLVLLPNTGSKDLPPLQQMLGTNLKRASDGNYSWLATIVADPSEPAISSKLTVSVAVFYKRDLANPGTSEVVLGQNNGSANFSGNGIGGGELQITFPNTPSVFSKGLKPGTWLMMAGTANPAPTQFPQYRCYFRWYRVVAAGALSAGTQTVTLAGPDWNTNISNVQAWLFDGVIAVYEKNMRLEIP